MDGPYITKHVINKYKQLSTWVIHLATYRHIFLKTFLGDFALFLLSQLNLMLNSEDGGDISGFMPNGKTGNIATGKKAKSYNFLDK